jgi:hypothetical protein
MKTDRSRDKLSGEESRRNNAKTLRAAFFSRGDRSNYCFQIIDLLRGVPIIAALQSVGRFSRAFSKRLYARLFCEINCDS